MKDSRQQTANSMQYAVGSRQKVVGRKIEFCLLLTPYSLLLTAYRFLPTPYPLFGRPTLHHKGAGQGAEQNPVPDWYRAGSPLPPTPYPLLPNKGGFALISVIIILALMGIATGVATSFAHRLKTSRRQVATEDELKALKEAILGNPREYSKQGRSNFGYLGDMGGLPATLADLYDNTTSIKPAYALGTADQGAGWAGPYITPILREDLPDLLKDPYGTTYNYPYNYPITPDHPTVPYQRASDNEWVSAIIRSIGPNKTNDSGAGDDKQIEILRKETLSTVSGYVLDSTGAAISGATVTLYYPVAGSVSNLSTTTNASGLYSFSNIPFGTRTIAVSGSATGTLKFAEGSALAVDGNNLSFNVTNWGASPVIVNAIRLTYSISPNAYYEKAYVGSTQVFKYNAPTIPATWTAGTRGSSGDPDTDGWNFTDISISGGSTSPTTKRILVAADSVLLPSVILSSTGGGTLNIRYINFKKNRTSGSGGADASVENESFTVTLYNGAAVVLTQSFTALEQP